MELRSPHFAEGEPIPSEYTCDGHDTSPALTWRDVPPDARSLALVVDDPDAPAKVWVHWVLYDLPPDLTALPEGLGPEGTLANGARQGTNDFHHLGWGGPCPPGGTHRYRFTLYALDERLNLPPGATKDQLLRQMASHVLAKSELTGRYSRRR